MLFLDNIVECYPKIYIKIKIKKECVSKSLQPNKNLINKFFFDSIKSINFLR